MLASREQDVAGVFDTRHYAPALASLICNEVAAGSSLSKVCDRPGYPPVSVFMYWTTREPELSHAYDMARKSRAEFLTREALIIADDASQDWVDVPRRNGTVETVLNHEHVARSKLRVSLRQWLAARLDRDAFGDKRQVNVDARILTVDLTDAELDKRLKAIRAEANAIEIETGP